VRGTTGPRRCTASPSTATTSVWLGGSGDADGHLLVFTRDGTFVRQIGRPGMRRDPASPADAPEWVAGNDDLDHFGRVAKIVVHEERGLCRRRLSQPAGGGTRSRVGPHHPCVGGLWRRCAGPAAPGPAAGEPSHFDNVHCVELSRDGLVYVCDRFHSRIQVFRTDGTFVAERRVADPGVQTGAAWDIAFSPDDDQAFLYLADGRSMKIRVLRRDTLEEVTTFGAGGRQPGQFYGVHSLATDSAGNLYTTEAFEGKRVQRFLYRGLAPITAADQGPPWPAAD
jgi:hypothetical protein